MSIEHNKTVVRRYFEEVCNQRNFGLADELFAPEFGSSKPGGITGPERAIHAFQHMLVSFPDIHFTVDEMIAEGDTVVVRVTWRGTHQGEFMGIAATGRPVEVSGVELARLSGGKIVAEGWHYLDHAGLLHQLGIVISH
jgi:steroid delta-isomerase-like uncharacterized protein